MRRLAAALLVAVAACGSPAPPDAADRRDDGSWTTGAEMPTPRTEVGVAVLDRRIYAVGGFTGNGRASAVVEVYDTAADRWETDAPLPEARHHAGVAAAAGRVYVVGGYGQDGRPSNKVWSRSGAEDAWREEPPLPTARGALAAAAYQSGSGAIVHAVGGVQPPGRNSAAHEVFDSSARRWSRAPAFPDPRDHLSAAILGSTLYVIGGRKQSLTRNTARMDVFDLESSRWSRGRDMPTARGGLAAAAGVRRVYVVGGEATSGTFEEVEVYDQSANSWSAAPDLPTPRHGLGAVVVGDRLFVVAGGPEPGLHVSGALEILRIEREN